MQKGEVLSAVCADVYGGRCWTFVSHQLVCPPRHIAVTVPFVSLRAVDINAHIKFKRHVSDTATVLYLQT
jgi:hypothetical protein